MNPKNFPSCPKFQSLLFVCLGNICRSPLAEGYARFLCAQHKLNLEVDSAGTSSWHIDEAPCEGSRLIAKKHGFSIDSLKGRKISVYADEKFDIILALDRNNRANLLKLGFEKSKVFLLGDFGLRGEDVPDPYGYKDMDGFESIYAMITHCIDTLFALRFGDMK